MAEIEKNLVRARTIDDFISNYPWFYDLTLELWWHSGPRLRKALPYIRGPRVLEVSFGVGWLMAQYAGRFQTTGIDYNPNYVEAARRRLQKLNIKAELLQGDAHALPFPDNSFDTLLNTDSFTLYQNPQQAMREFYRVLVPGGRLVLLEWGRPQDGNAMGKLVYAWGRFIKVPYVNFAELLPSVGFSFEQQPIGFSGVLHMYLATKPAAAVTASGTT